MIRIKQSDIIRDVTPDPIPNTSYLEQDGFEDRRAAYGRGAFDYVGVQARVVLRVPHGPAFIVIPIQTPGLWGIESDSGEDYLNEVFAEERSVLVDLLGQLNVTVEP